MAQLGIRTAAWVFPSFTPIANKSLKPYLISTLVVGQVSLGGELAFTGGPLGRIGYVVNRAERAAGLVNSSSELREQAIICSSGKALGASMKSRRVCPVLFLILTFASLALADDTKIPSSAPHMSKETRMDLIRAFEAELVYVRTPFPMGKKGLTLKDGTVSPNGPELQQLIALWGPSVKPGDQARISAILIKDKSIYFEINGGPVRKPKWYQRIEISGAGGAGVPLAPSDSSANPRGSYVDLVFPKYVPEMTPQQLKSLLSPVFDFNSKSALDAYLETVPPIVKAAIKDHRVLVGMNHDMVIYAKGRAEKKNREKIADVEYEEWIYGEPPHDVDFVRFVGDEVVRVETMKVGGEKMVRTEKEVQLPEQPTIAKAPDEPQVRPANAPTLRRPGEDIPSTQDPTRSTPNPSTQPMPAPPPSQDPGIPKQGPNQFH